ncbi:MAG: hypothetical protein ACJAT2_000760 [Bacteriovoracaceae bacterium]|jgi:hypothetical protein
MKVVAKEKMKSVSNTPKEMMDPPIKANFTPTVRKELNSFGKVFILGLWGFIAFVAGVKLTMDRSISSEKVADLEKKFESLRLESEERANRMGSTYNARVKYVAGSIEKKVDDKIYELTLEQEKTLSQKNQQIQDLKDELEYRDAKEVIRKPGSIMDSKKVVNYSYKNLDILRYAHNQKVKRLKELQRVREQKFADATDLSNPTNMSAFRKLKEEHDLELYALKRTFEDERRKFRKQKFYVKY